MRLKTWNQQTKHTLDPTMEAYLLHMYALDKSGQVIAPQHPLFEDIAICTLLARHALIRSEITPRAQEVIRLTKKGLEVAHQLASTVYASSPGGTQEMMRTPPTAQPPRPPSRAAAMPCAVVDHDKEEPCYVALYIDGTLYSTGHTFAEAVAIITAFGACMMVQAVRDDRR